MFDPDTDPGNFSQQSFEAAALSHAIELVRASVRTDANIERVIASFGRNSTMGLFVQGDLLFGAGQQNDLATQIDVDC
jgi:hypothetical protein